MWRRRYPSWIIPLSLVLVLAATESAIGGKSSHSLDIQLRWTSNDASHVDITICAMLLKEQEVNPDEAYLLTLTDYTGTTIRADKTILQEEGIQCFNVGADITKFHIKENVDVCMYKIVNHVNNDPRRYKLLTERVIFLAPKVEVLSEDLVFVQWNNSNGQRYSLSDDADGSSPRLCNSQICQFFLENTNLQNFLKVTIQTENETQTNQFAEFEIDMDKGHRAKSGLTKINYLRQSITNNTDGGYFGDPFITFEMEAPGIPSVECVSGTISISGTQQPFEMCDGWDGRKEIISISHAELTAKIEDVDIVIIAQTKSTNTIVDVSRMDFNTSAIMTTFSIVGSSSDNNAAFLRVEVGSDENAVSINDETCEPGSICYYPYSGKTFEDRSKNIDVQGTGVSGNYSITQYDDSVMPFVNLEELVEVTLLNEKTLDISANYDDSTDSIEAFIFDPAEPNKNPGGLECSIYIGKDSLVSCNLDPNFDTSYIDQLNIVILTLNSNRRVLKSTLVVLNDLKMNVEMFTPSSLKVTWNRSTEDHYMLNIDPVPSSYKSISSMCKPALDNCLAFFTDVDSVYENYTLSVKEKGSKTKVARTITITNITDPPANVSISKVIESNDCTKLELDLSPFTKVRRVEVAVTRLNDTDMAKQTIIDAQKILDGNIYTSSFRTNPEEEDAFNNETELIILGYDEHDEVVVTSYLKYQYADILVDFTSVGNSVGSEGSSLRVASITKKQNLYVGDSKCPFGEACYIIEPKTQTLAICTDGVTKKETSFMLCDETQEPLEFQGINEISNLILTDVDHLEISGDFNSSKESVEILLYDPTDGSILDGAQLCIATGINSTCALELNSPVPNDLILFNVLIVVIDSNQKVLESLFQPFEDLKIKLEMFTVSSMKVTWNGNTEDQYLIDIEPVPSSYKSISTSCTSQLENCFAFFTLIEAENEYTLSARKEGSVNKVVQTIKITNDTDLLNKVNISKVIESESCTKLEIDLSQLEDVSVVEIAVTRFNGIDTAKQTIMSVQKGEDGNIYSSSFLTNPEDEGALNNVTELIILGYKDDNEIIATSYLSYQYTDIVVDFTSVGSFIDSDGSSLRVAAIVEEQILYIGETNCTYGNACYFIEPESNKLEICVDGEYKVNSQFKQCDETQEPSEFQGINEISTLLLTDEKYLELSGEFDSSKDTIEMILYDPINRKIISDAHICVENERKSTCSIELQSPLQEKQVLFNDLIVVTDTNQKVLQSLLKPVEDLKLNSCLITEDSLEVYWNQNENNDEYTVTISPTLHFSNLNGICRFNESCKAFFSNLDKEGQYTLLLQKNEDPRIFATTLNVADNINGVPPPIGINKLIKSDEKTKISVSKENLSKVETIDVSIVTNVNGLPSQEYYTVENITEDQSNLVFSLPFMITPDEVELILIAKSNEGKTVGSVSLSYKYEDILVDFTSVGNFTRSNGSSLRVSALGKNQVLHIGDSLCTYEEACYFIEPDTDILEVCEEVSYNDNMVFYQCDETLLPADFKGNENISGIILLDETELVISSNEDSEVKSSEIYLYYDDDVDSEKDVIKCKDPTTCSITMIIPEEEHLLKILVVSLNKDNNVLKSSLILFEDLKLNVTNLTPDILAANWNHGDNINNYEVYLESENLYIMSNLESSCDNNATCTALFSNVDPEHQYKVTVQKAGNNLTQISKSYYTSNDTESPIEIGISNVIESEGFTKITLEKTNWPSTLKSLGVSITSKDAQTFVPATIISENEESIVYSIPFVFDSIAKRQNSEETEMILVGLDESDKVIASAEIEFQYQELLTKISPVGAALDNAAHSVRVVRGDGEALQNSDGDCSIGSPCYLIEPNTTISACGEKINGNEFVLCNEASSDFKEISDDVTVTLSTEGVMHVSTTLPESDLTLEVVVYMEKYPHTIISNADKYKCVVNNIRDAGYSCSQTIDVTKDLERAWVLVVAIDSDNSVVQSTRVNIPFNKSTGVETWVIVVSSIGGLFGLIFIIFAVVVTWKKISTKKQEKELISQNHDTRSENNSNLQNEHEDPHGDDLHMSHLRSQDNYKKENGHENPSFDDSSQNRTNIAQNVDNYSPQNNTRIVNNIRQNPYAEPYTPGNVAKRISRPYEDPRPYVDHRPYEDPRPYKNPRPYEVPRPNHPYPNARQRSPPPQHANSRHSNAYDSPLESDYYLPYKHPSKPKEPIYARLTNDKATRNATEPIALAPIPRISMHPSRAKQYKAITETTAIPPQGRWDVDV